MKGRMSNQEFENYIKQMGSFEGRRGLMKCMPVMPVELQGQVEEALEKSAAIGPVKTADTLISAAKLLVHRKYHRLSSAFIQTFFDTPEYAKIMKDRMLRARMGGYLAYCVAASCRSDDMGTADKLLSLCGNFVFEDELSLNDWIVPMSGNMAVDVRANYFAKHIRKSSFDTGRQLFREALDLTTEQIVDDMGEQGKSNLVIPFFLNKFDQYSLSLDSVDISDIPDVIRNDKNMLILKFFQKAEGVGPSNPHQTSAFIMNRILRENNDRATLWDAMHTSKLPFSGLSPYNLGYPYAPGYGFIDTNGVSPSKASLGVSSALTDMRYSSVESEASPKDDFWRMSFDELASCADTSRLIDRERTDILNAIKQKDMLRAKDQEINQLKQALQREKEKNAMLLSNKSDKTQKVENDLSNLKAKYEATVQHMTAVETQNETLKKKVRSLSERIANQEQSSAAMDNEISILQQQIVNSYDDASSDTELDTSVFDGMRIVCEGGHKSWIAGMLDLHKNIQYYGSEDTPPSDDVIRNADILWLQVNSLSHSRFWNAVNTAKQAGIPIRYFTSAGHKFCRREIVNETIKYLEQNPSPTKNKEGKH